MALHQQVMQLQILQPVPVQLTVQLQLHQQTPERTLMYLHPGAQPIQQEFLLRLLPVHISLQVHIRLLAAY